MAAFTTVNDPNSFFNSVLYTGTGSSLGVTGVGFQPDFTWIKNRDAADFHVLTDAVIGATIYRRSNAISEDATNVESLKTFDSDGFTVGTQAEVNSNTEDYVSWNWKAGTTTGIAGSPSITPTSYSFNATSGFSIIEYTGNGSSGATLPHGLGVAPGLILGKRTVTNNDWVAYHSSLGATKNIVINTTAAPVTTTGIWNDTEPTSTLFSLGDNDKINYNTQPYVAYCFAPKQGYSKMGIYKGNGNADGTSVWTGFQPAYVLIKETSNADDWNVFDNKRPTFYDPVNPVIKPNTTAADNTTASYDVDFLAAGFKLTGTNGGTNTFDAEYIYLAFADQPFVNSNGVPCTAR